MKPMNYPSYFNHGVRPKPRCKLYLGSQERNHAAR